MIGIDREIVKFYNNIPNSNKLLKKIMSKWVYERNIPIDVYRLIMNGDEYIENNNK